PHLDGKVPVCWDSPWYVGTAQLTDAPFERKVRPAPWPSGAGSREIDYHIRSATRGVAAPRGRRARSPAGSGRGISLDLCSRGETVDGLELRKLLEKTLPGQRHPPQGARPHPRHVRTGVLQGPVIKDSQVPVAPGVGVDRLGRI